jgi:transcriptional regulator with XRE-family HTH domain
MATNGPEIRRRRQAMGVKLGPFAQRVDCSVKHLNNVENGNKGASPELLHRIAAALETDVATLTVETVENNDDPATDSATEQVPA